LSASSFPLERRDLMTAVVVALCGLDLLWPGGGGGGGGLVWFCFLFCLFWCAGSCARLRLIIWARPSAAPPALVNLRVRPPYFADRLHPDCGPAELPLGVADGLLAVRRFSCFSPAPPQAFRLLIRDHLALQCHLPPPIFARILLGINWGRRRRSGGAGDSNGGR